MIAAAAVTPLPSAEAGGTFICRAAQVNHRDAVIAARGRRDPPRRATSMDESPREKWAMWLGILATVLPGMIPSNFMPKWNVLPFIGWLAVATVGSATAGAIAAPRWFRGAIAGALAGVGALLGIWLYVLIRAELTGHTTF